MTQRISIKFSQIRLNCEENVEANLRELNKIYLRHLRSSKNIKEHQIGVNIRGDKS